MSQEDAKSIKRATAIKVYIHHLLSGNYVKDEINSYIETKFGIRISRARILGTIVGKWISSSQKEVKPDFIQQATLIIDDGTETIRVKAWKEDIEKFEVLRIGDIVDIIGRVREYENEIYLTPEIIRKIQDPNWELVRELEIIEFLGRIKSNSKFQTIKLESQRAPMVNTGTLIGNKNEKNILKDKIVELIKDLDEGFGVSINQLKEQADIPEIDFQSAIMELINEGTIYQPSSGKYKIL